MSAPYRRMEFTATSGNKCSLRVFPPNGIRLVVDASWKDPPRDADMAECDAWLPSALDRVLVTRIGGTFSTRIEDQDEREALIESLLDPASDPGRN